MHIAIIALLIVIVLILLGLFVPTLIGLALAVYNVAPTVFVIAGIGLAWLVIQLGYLAVKESRQSRTPASTGQTTSGVSEKAKARGARSVHDW